MRAASSLVARLHPHDRSKILVDRSRVLTLRASNDQAEVFSDAGCAKDKLVRASPTKCAGFPVNLPSGRSDLAELLMHGQSSDEGEIA